MTFVKFSSVTACETAPCSNTIFDLLLAHYNTENVGFVSPECGWKKNLTVFFSSDVYPTTIFPLKGKGETERENKSKRMDQGSTPGFKTGRCLMLMCQ